MQTHRKALLSLVMALVSLPLFGETWYIRPDGGTRYSEKKPTGQCDGKADAPYRGRGANQRCAFRDYRYLWDDQSYGSDRWVISGGDTVIIRGGPWRVGFDASTGKDAGYTWCFGGQGPQACSNPTIPAGSPRASIRASSAKTTRVAQSGNNTDRSRLTQIFGGFGVWNALNLAGAQYVDVECLEVTSHSHCITHGYPQFPRGCNSGNPLDDYDSDGISTRASTHATYFMCRISGSTDTRIRASKVPSEAW